MDLMRGGREAALDGVRAARSGCRERPGDPRHRRDAGARGAGWGDDCDRRCGLRDTEAALSLARENAARLGLRVRWLRSDLLLDVADEFDAVLANLPYVAEGERALLAPEILRHEPAGALFAGADGLAVIRALLAQLQLRRRVRMVALEVGAGQAPAVAELVAGAGFAAVRCERDLAGIE